MQIDSFITKWSASSAAERANKDLFLLDLCEVLQVEKPHPTTDDIESNTYTFERDALLVHEGEKTSVGKMDLYKEGHFILEAKQGSEQGSKKLGTAKRGTAAWNIAMHDAFGQAVGYARTLSKPPPFIITTDIGHCFELFAAFDGTGRYSQFPDVKRHRLYLNDLRKKETLDLLRTVFTNPTALDPSNKSAKVTREVAAHLAELAKDLDASKHPPERVARFLMRAIFTMFAEDVGLLTERLFTDALDQYWLPNPSSFPAGISGLWKAMNEGKSFGFFPKLLRFNGGLFKDAEALPLTKAQLKLLRDAAACDWSEVEPSIFGTLLERALDPVERHRLGAHYTPRAYVERLVRPTVEEPLREEWDLVRAEVRAFVEKDEIAKARKALLTFQTKLAGVRVLDPACGTGNFLYVTLDLMKRLEAEVLSMLSDVEGGERGRKPGLSAERAGWAAVTPAQFLGLEVKPWAKEIAELVLWIGYIQWHFRTHGRDEKPAEPVLHDYGNIECRDALLAWDSVTPEVDAQGKPLTRWDGRTMKVSPVTGEEVPDESARVPVYRYVNPVPAKWPKADFIVGNPPFIGAQLIRGTLGDGYIEALWTAYDDVPASADFVMYWWWRAAQLAATSAVTRFGLISTNKLGQKFNLRVVTKALATIRLRYALPDHPWGEGEDRAAVRIAMTVGERKPAEPDGATGVLEEAVTERTGDGQEPQVQYRHRFGEIQPDLTIGVALQRLQDLVANSLVGHTGVKLHGKGFLVPGPRAREILVAKPSLSGVLRPYTSGRALAQRPTDEYVIDFFALDQSGARALAPDLLAHLIDNVKPERDAKALGGTKDSVEYARLWWLFGKPRPELRKALDGLDRFIVTVRTARHRVFQFLDATVVPESKLVVIASDDPLHLGFLSSRIHVLFAERVGGWLGVGNDATYNHGDCFNKFPLPVPPSPLVTRIRTLGAAIDAHRKAQQAAHPSLTITDTYNVLQKLYEGTPLSAEEKATHDRGLVGLLKQLHDDLDAAVFDAYGWPHDLTDEQILERLVKLNAERAAEEAKGLVRWLRPDFQTKGEKKPTQASLLPEGTPAQPVAAKVAQPWPKALPEQIAAVRSLLAAGDALSIKVAAKAFKRADKADLEASLDALVALGLAVSFDVTGERRWSAAGRVAA